MWQDAIGDFVRNSLTLWFFDEFTEGGECYGSIINSSHVIGNVAKLVTVVKVNLKINEVYITASRQP